MIDDKDSMTARMLSMALLLAAPVYTQAQPTFYGDVLPILQRSCQDCHRAGEAAPMSLMTYREARPWAKAIKSAVLTRTMPPWFADPHYGKFSGDPSLSASEIGVLTAWADGGAKAGNASDAPPARRFPSEWKIGKPDAIFELPQPVQVPATGAVDYQYYVVPTGFTEDHWVEAIEVRPTDRSVVHHAIVYVQGDQGWSVSQYLGGYAPGAVPQIWKPGQARLIKAGSSLLFQMHYTTNGKPATDRTRVGFVFAKRPPEQQVIAMLSTNHWFQIPPENPDYVVDSVRVIPLDSYLVGMRAHMHVRGKSFEFRAVYPDGRTEILLRVPNYDFNWQPYYYLENPIKLPRGTRMECTAHFDNSADNPFNPNPQKTVGWGEQSWDEMMIGWLDVAFPVRRELTGMRIGPRPPALGQ
jgi:hypothetical protein